MGYSLYSSHHHPSKCSWNSKVFFLKHVVTLLVNECMFLLPFFFHFYRSIHLVAFWILFENVMSLHRTKATLIGLFEAQRVNEWVVTEKTGDPSKAKTKAKQHKNLGFKLSERYLFLLTINLKRFYSYIPVTKCTHPF